MAEQPLPSVSDDTLNSGAPLSFAAAAHRFAAAQFRQSDLAWRREFADVLDTWADRAERASLPEQPGLFDDGAIAPHTL